MSREIDMFLSQIVLNQGLPFHIKKPNKEVTSKRKDLADAINLTGGKEYPKEFKKIMNLYANGEIDYDLALNAIKRDISYV